MQNTIEQATSKVIVELSQFLYVYLNKMCHSRHLFELIKNNNNSFSFDFFQFVLLNDLNHCVCDIGYADKCKLKVKNFKDCVTLQVLLLKIYFISNIYLFTLFKKRQT